MTQVWLNGVLVPAEKARIDPMDRGFTLGDGIFETIRAEAGKPAYLARHLARLRHGAGVLGFDVPWSDWILTGALRAVADGTDCALRLTLSRGPMARGVLPARHDSATTLITSAPLPQPLPPARVIIAQNTRRNEFSPLSRIKSLNYGDSILARQEACAAGADDALLLNTRGTLAEATAGNVFIVIDDHILTPPVTDGALPGIRRAQLLKSRKALEQTVTYQDLARASAGFIANALGIRMLADINGMALDPRHTKLGFLGVQSSSTATPK